MAQVSADGAAVLHGFDGVLAGSDAQQDMIDGFKIVSGLAFGCMFSGQVKPSQVAAEDAPRPESKTRPMKSAGCGSMLLSALVERADASSN